MTTDCAGVRRQLWEFLDAELPRQDLAGIERHVARCRPCRQATAFDRSFLELLWRQRAGLAPAQLVWEVKVSLLFASP